MAAVVTVPVNMAAVHMAAMAVAVQPDIFHSESRNHPAGRN